MKARLVLASLGLCALTLPTGHASAAGLVGYQLLVSGPANSVATLTLSSQVQVGGLVPAPVAGPAGTYAGVIVRDAKGRILVASVVGQPAGVPGALATDFGKVSALPAGRYTVELLGDRPQQLRVALFGRPGTRALKTAGSTADRVNLLSSGTRPSAGAWADVLSLDPSTVFLAQVAGSVDPATFGQELCALPPSSGGCQQSRPNGPDLVEDVGAYEVHHWCFTGPMLPGRDLLTSTTEGGTGGGFESIVTITAASSAPFAHVS